MRWYNIIGILIILADIIGGILGANGIIFQGWSLKEGMVLFFIILVVGLMLSFTSFEKETKEEIEED